MPDRGELKQRLERKLPPGLMARLLGAWRTLYWWNRQRRPMPGHARATVKRLLGSEEPIQLELGSGPREGMEAWTSLDLAPGADIRHDLNDPLPFPDNSVDRIYSSHVLEHFTYPHELLRVLHECLRVLKPGGVISAAVPNARIFLEAYGGAKFDREKFCTEDVGLKYTSRIDVVNFIAFLGGHHKFMFDEENLPRVLEEAGFRNVRLRSFDPTIDLVARAHESIYAEGVK